MSLKGNSMVTDIRTIGLVAAIDLEPVAGTPGKRAYDAMEKGFHDHGIMLRITADTLALSPPLIIDEAQIDEIFADRLPKVLKAIA
jgi:beta-alanine--pyruvate transaminase